MSFESPDDNDRQLYTPYAEEVYGTTDAVDGYPAPDLIPPEDSYTTEASAGPRPLMEELSYRTVHYIDGQTITGDHPDRRVAEYVDARIQACQADDARRLDFFTRQPHYPDAGTEQYSKVVDILGADFGAEVADTPIAIISEKGYEEYDKIATGGKEPRVLGLYSAGHIVIVHRPQKIEDFGEKQPLKILLHEGAHSSATDWEYIVSSRPLTGKDTNITKNEQAAGHRVTILKVGGLSVYDPAHPDKTVGILWEESFSESYACRRKGEIGIPMTFDAPSDRKTWGNQGPRYATIFTDNGPYFDSTNKAINIPWKYVHGFYRFNGKGVPNTPAIYAGTYGAFALDILDSRLPGLFGEIVQSRREPELKPDIEARIDSIAPGLYRDLGLREWNIPNAELALIKVIKALGIADERYEF